MPMVTADDVVRMRDQLFFEGAQQRSKLSKFWLLLGLSAVIATAGVVADSTATVIGAMIVAPLMTPILGVVLGITLADSRNLVRSLLLVLAGAAAVILISWLLGVAAAIPVVADTNGQVAGRVNPRVVDLVAALATGAVGAFALARSDVSDTLPGVAIAISLVPPLAVVGLTLQAGETEQAMGALLLFVTNVTAILLSGVVVMAIFRVAAARPVTLDPRIGRRRKEAVALVVVSVVLVAIPLSYTSQQIATDHLQQGDLDDVVSTWAEQDGWEVDAIQPRDEGGWVVRVAGPEPAPDTTDLRQLLDDGGLRGVPVQVDLVPEVRVLLEPAG